jgi:pyruvate dehydrogenase E1 component beta subunit
MHLRELTYREAIREAIGQEMAADENILIMGEDIGVYGGMYGVTQGLLAQFKKDRVRDTPVAETAIVGTAIGAALAGMKPIVEIMSSDFMFVAANEINNDAAKWRYQHGGKVKVPLVLRAPVGTSGGTGPEHAQSPEAYYLHTPGLKIVMPSTPYDAKGLLISAIHDGNPVLYFEHRRLYDVTGDVPEEVYKVPIGLCKVIEEGSDATIISWSWMLHRSLEAADRLRKEGLNAEVIDLRSILPMDREGCLKSARKTGRVVVVEESNVTGGVGAEISAFICENAFEHLEAPISRVGFPDIPVPFNPALENWAIPSVERIVESVRTVCAFQRH